MRRSFDDDDCRATLFIVIKVKVLARGVSMNRVTKMAITFIIPPGWKRQPSHIWRKTLYHAGLVFAEAEFLVPHCIVNRLIHLTTL